MRPDGVSDDWGAPRIIKSDALALTLRQLREAGARVGRPAEGDEGRGEGRRRRTVRRGRDDRRPEARPPRVLEVVAEVGVDGGDDAPAGRE